MKLHTAGMFSLHVFITNDLSLELDWCGGIGNVVCLACRKE